MKITFSITAYLAIASLIFSQAITVNDAYDLLNSNRDSSYSIVNRLLTEDLTTKDKYQVYYLKGYIEQKRGRNQEALWSYLESLRLLDLSKFSDDDNKATMYNQIGKIYKLYSHYELAIEYYKRSLKVSPEKYKKSIYYNIGNAFNKLGNGVEAIEYYQKALAHSSGDLNQQAKVNSMIAVVNYTHGNYRDAENYLYRVANQLGKIDTVHIGRAYHRLGLNYVLKGDSSKAATSFETALSYKRGKDKFPTLLSLAEIYLSRSEYERAIQLCDHAETYKDDFLGDANISKIYQFRAEAYYHKEDITRYKGEIDKYVAFNDRLNTQIGDAVVEGKREMITEVTRRHDEAVERQAQQRRYLWLGGVLALFVFMTVVLTFREYKKRKIKKRITSELKNLQRQYSHRI